MNESELQRFYNYPIHPSNSKICSVKEFENLDNGSQRRYSLVLFYKKRYKIILL